MYFGDRYLHKHTRNVSRLSVSSQSLFSTSIRRLLHLPLVRLPEPRTFAVVSRAQHFKRRFLKLFWCDMIRSAYESSISDCLSLTSDQAIFVTCPGLTKVIRVDQKSTIAFHIFHEAGTGGGWDRVGLWRPICQPGITIPPSVKLQTSRAPVKYSPLVKS